MIPVSYHDGQLVCSGSSKFLRDLVLNVLLQKQQQRRTACCGTFHDCGLLSLCCNTTVMLQRPQQAVASADPRCWAQSLH
jgi:hypothetical protein